MTLVSLERIKNYIQTQINPYGEPFKGTITYVAYICIWKGAGRWIGKRQQCS